MTTTQNIQLDLFDDNSNTLSITAATPYWVTDSASNIYTTGAWGDSSLSFGDNLKPNTLQVSGDAEFNGNLTVGGINLKDTLLEIERRLNILRVDPELESRWNELKELGERYRALEAECLDKEYIIEILKR